MKKLMTMVAAVATSLGLFAAVDFTTSVNSDLSARNPGDTNIVGVDDDGEGDSNIHWWDDAYTASGYEQPAVVSNDTVVGNYLKIEADNALLRTFDNVTVGQDAAEYDPINIDAHGVFVSTKVRLTGFDSDLEVPADNTNKLFVWLKAVDAEGDEEGVTNLMVTCGSWNLDEVTPTNYVLTAEGFEAKVGEWVELTIRADQGEENIPAFKIYINGKQAKGDDTITSFQSLLGGKSTDVALSATGFKGTGDINYVDLLTANDAPAFAADPTFLTLTWDANVDSITIDDVNVIEGKTSPYAYPIDAFGSDISATIAYKTGSEKKAVTATNVADFNEAGNTVSFKVARYAEATLDVVSKFSRDEVELTIDGEPVTETFASIKDVVDYVVEQGKTASAIAMKLKLSEEASDFGDFSQLTDVTIDLAGNSLTAAAPWTGALDPIWGYSIIHNGSGCTLVIKDTVGGGAINGIVDEDAGVAVLLNDGDATLVESADPTKQIKFNGAIWSFFDGETYFGTLDIQGGKFIEPITSDGVTLPEGKTWSAGPDGEGFYTFVEAVKGTVLLITDAGTATNDYQTLALALADAKSGDIVMPTATIAELQTTITVNEGVTLDLNNQIVNVDFHQTKLSNSGTIVIYNTSLALVNNWYIGGKFVAGEALTNANFLFPKGTQMDVAKQTAVQTAITITGESILWGLPIESNKLVTVDGTATIDAKIYPTATLTVPNAITPKLTTIDGFEVKSTVGAAMTTWAAEEKQGGDIPIDPEKDITDDTKPADIGLDPAGPFKDAKKDELIKLSKWANMANLKAAAINETVLFDADGNPTTDNAEAYLLNCDPADTAAVKAAKDAFQVTSITQGGAGNWIVKVTGDKGDTDAYLNGHVDIVDVTEMLDAEAKEASDAKGFFQAKLVK